MKSLTSKNQTEPILSIARIQRPRGFSGHLRATFRGEFLEELAGHEVTLYHASGIRDGFLQDPEPAGSYPLLTADFAGAGVAALEFEGVHSLESAEALKGLYIGLPLSEAKKLFFDPDEPYLFQYIGMKVIYRGTQVGKALRIEENGAQQWLIISYEKSAEKETVSTQEGVEKEPSPKQKVKELMVPMNSPFIEKTDFEADEIHMIDLEYLDV